MECEHWRLFPSFFFFFCQMSARVEEGFLDLSMGLVEFNVTVRYTWSKLRLVVMGVACEPRGGTLKT